MLIWSWTLAELMEIKFWAFIQELTLWCWLWRLVALVESMLCIGCINGNHRTFGRACTGLWQAIHGRKRSIFLLGELSHYLVEQPQRLNVSNHKTQYEKISGTCSDCKELCAKAGIHSTWATNFLFREQ